MWQKIKNWFKTLFSGENAKKLATEVHQTVVATASQTVNQFVNDPANQAAARDAVIAVAKGGISGNEALDAAVAILKERGHAAGLAGANTLLRTLVQVVYAVFKIA